MSVRLMLPLVWISRLNESVRDVNQIADNSENIPQTGGTDFHRNPTSTSFDFKTKYY